MTPDTTPQRRSAEELEREAEILEGHGSYIEATETWELAKKRHAEDLRKQSEQQGTL